MIALMSILALGFLPLSHAADRLAVRERMESASVTVTVTVDWLYRPDPTTNPDPEETASFSSSSSSWEGWGPSDTYSQPPDPSSTSSSTGGACRPHTSHWSNSLPMPVSTLITTRSVTITTFITEAWSTVSEEVTPSPTTETEGVDYPFPTWTGCPDVNNAFKCAGDDNDEDDDDQRHVIAVKARAGTGEGDEAESSVTDDTEPQESVAMFSSARGTRDAVCGLLWLVMGVMMVML